jgi:hypothetical protein
MAAAWQASVARGKIKGMKLVAKNKSKPEDVSLRDDPRVRDVGVWNTLRIMVENEAIDPAWRCPLYQLHKTGWITTEQREAGDRYWKAWDNYNTMQRKDPDDEPNDDLLLRRIKKAKEIWRDCIDILGIGRSVMDALVIREEHLTERQKYIARDGLQLLVNYFHLGTKRERKPMRVVL